VLMGEVIKIDKEMQTVTLAPDQIFPYDYLVVACGARHSYFGNDPWEKWAPGLKTLPDALAIRENILLSFERAERLDDLTDIEKCLNFIIIGGGPTGVEMAGAIAEIAHSTLFKNFRRIQPEKAQVILIEAAPRVLPPYPSSLSARAQKDLEKLGVKVLTNTKVTNVTAEGVETDKGFFPSYNIIWAAGNQASPLLRELDSPLDRQGRIVVEKDLTVPHHPNIFVIGDAGCCMTPKGTPVPAVATAAIQQGCYVGKLLNKATPPVARKPFKYFDKGSLATIGKAKAVAFVGGLKFSGFFAWILWAFIHILYLIGFKNRYAVLLQWYFHYVNGLRGARLIHRAIDERKP